MKPAATLSRALKPAAHASCAPARRRSGDRVVGGGTERLLSDEEEEEDGGSARARFARAPASRARALASHLRVVADVARLERRVEHPRVPQVVRAEARRLDRGRVVARVAALDRRRGEARLARLGRVEARLARLGRRLDQPAARAVDRREARVLERALLRVQHLLDARGRLEPPLERRAPRLLPLVRRRGRDAADLGHRVLHRRDRAPRRVRRVARGERAPELEPEHLLRALGRVKVEARARARRVREERRGRAQARQVVRRRGRAARAARAAAAAPPRPRAVRAGGDARDGARDGDGAGPAVAARDASYDDRSCARREWRYARMSVSPRSNAPAGGLAALGCDDRIGDAGGHH